MMDLQIWLGLMETAKGDIGPDHAMREWVTGLHKRGLIYHFDDDASDCLCGVVTPEQARIINYITKELYCEDMFTLAIQLAEDVDAEVYLKGRMADRQGNALGVHSCFCNIKDLATWGCKCGGV